MYLNQGRTEHEERHDKVAKPACLDSLEDSFCEGWAPWQQTACAFVATHILPADIKHHIIRYT